MRIVTLEEHFDIPALVARIPQERIRQRGFPPPDEMPSQMAGPQNKLKDLGAKRLAAMNAGGVAVQVLSMAGPGADLLLPEQGIPWAREANDTLAAAIAAHPTRFAGFAHLPMTAPEAAADELERCICKHRFVGTLVNGTTDDKFLDDPRFEPILARAEQLDVPIYIHPNIPPEAVRKLYYENLPGQTGYLLSIAGFG